MKEIYPLGDGSLGYSDARLGADDLENTRSWALFRER
jgi:hypothetical protein